MKEIKIMLLLTIVLAVCFMSGLTFAEQKKCINFLDAADCNPKKVVFVDKNGKVGIGTDKPDLELEKAHIYIEQLHKKIKNLEKRLNNLEEKWK